MTSGATLLALALALSAPFQCASEPNPERRMEDSPSEALWHLAERFEAEGEDAARRTTLEELVERYPASREAGWARDALADLP
ncbi:MAG: hypothetical protein AAGH15_07840 [Myxococcota bacterium]